MSMNRYFLLAACLGLATTGQAATKPAAKKTPVAKKKVVPKPAAKPASPRPRPAVPAAPTPGPNPPEAVGAPEPVAPPPIVPPVSIGPKTWALLVGVSKYDNPSISSLKYPARDASGLRDALLDPTLGGLSANNVKLLSDENATRDDIMGAVDSFLRPNVKPGDQVIVFLAGHGIAKGVGLDARSYLLPNDVKGLTTASLESSAVNLRTLANSLSELPAAQFVLFVDACREDPTPGRTARGNTMSDVLARGIQVQPKDEKANSATFFACSVGQRAFEDPALGHGVFTNAILDGIRQGAVPQKPDGAVPLGRLSSYVVQRVAEWAKATSARGDFEVEQTPELISSQANRPLVLFKVKRPLTDTYVAPVKPKLLVAAYPEGAQVAINGQRAGSGTVEQSLNSPGTVTVTVTANGYAPYSRSVTAMEGYEHQVVVNLTPSSGGTAASPALDLFNRAEEAAARQQWEIAEQGYLAAIGADPRFVPAYGALMEQHRLQNRNIDALGDAISLYSNVREPRSLVSLARAYSRFADKGAGVDNVKSSLVAVSGYGLPRNPGDAASLAQKAAGEALAADANSAEANLAQGYALAAGDDKGKNKAKALSAFGKAAFLDPQNPATQLGLGYGQRFYASQQKKEDDKKNEVRRAVSTLQEAVRLRPTYYDALRELGYCYTLLDDTNNAMKYFQLANANRGAASDANEFAGNDVALAGLHKKAAANSSGQEKADHEAASAAYMDDAKENAKDMKVAMQFLNEVGVSTSLQSYMPAEVTKWMDVKGALRNEIQNKLPGGFRLPRF